MNEDVKALVARLEAPAFLVPRSRQSLSPSRLRSPLSLETKLMDPEYFKAQLNTISRMMNSLTKSESELKLDFVPVIFANGEDDDEPGLVAAISGKRVQYLNKIYSEFEQMILINCSFALTKQLILTDPVTGNQIPFDSLNEYKYHIKTDNGRIFMFSFCKVNYIAGPRM